VNQSISSQQDGVGGGGGGTNPKQGSPRQIGNPYLLEPALIERKPDFLKQSSEHHRANNNNSYLTEETLERQGSTSYRAGSLSTVQLARPSQGREFSEAAGGKDKINDTSIWSIDLESITHQGVGANGDLTPGRLKSN
jgi:hypothetical protein